MAYFTKAQSNPQFQAPNYPIQDPGREIQGGIEALFNNYLAMKQANRADASMAQQAQDRSNAASIQDLTLRREYGGVNPITDLTQQQRAMYSSGPVVTPGAPQGAPGSLPELGQLGRGLSSPQMNPTKDYGPTDAVSKYAHHIEAMNQLRLKSQDMASQEQQAGLDLTRAKTEESKADAYAKMNPKKGAAGLSPELAYRMGRDARKDAADIQELQIPGYKIAGKTRPTTKEAQDLRTSISAMESFNAQADKLSELIKTHGSSELWGKASGEMASLSSDMLLTLKDIKGLGVISKTDMDLMEAQIPDPSSIGSLFSKKDTALQKLETTRASAKSAVSRGLSKRGYVQEDGSGGPGQAISVGEVRKGYRFKGGNPADKSSWEKQ